jgi:hypothetical protein
LKVADEPSAEPASLMVRAQSSAFPVLHFRAAQSLDLGPAPSGRMTLQQPFSRVPADPETASGHRRVGINIDGFWIYSGGDIHG